MWAPRALAHADSASTPHVAPLPWSVLVVDPDDESRFLYRLALAPLDCDLLEASDGRDALTKAFVRPPALVVTEIRLPFVDGYALCEILRRDRTTTDVPILVVTAESRPIQIERARTAGADAVLLKPTTPEQLLAETRRLVADAKQIRVQTSEAHRQVPERKNVSQSKAVARFTTSTPPKRPQALVCPSCDAPLKYVHSHVGGVSDRHPEQWDYYVCGASCGTFQYRQRTRRLRLVE